MKTHICLLLPVICLSLTSCEPDETTRNIINGNAQFSSNDKESDVYLSKVEKIYDIQPNLANCETGALKDSVKQELITSLNDIRRLSGLSPVEYDYSSDNEVMLASLMFAANGKTSHYPNKSWKCYSELGALAAGKSNLSGGVGNLRFRPPEDHLVAWMHEVRNKIKDNIGHRRWLLDPFLERVAFGKVNTKYDNDSYVNGATLKVIYPRDNVRGLAVSEIIAYPVNNYPSKYFHPDALLSFSILSDTNNVENNDSIDYTNANITVIHRDSGKQVDVIDIAMDNERFGLPNNFQYRIQPFRYDTTYDVTVTGITINGQNKDINYWFKIVD